MVHFRIAIASILTSIACVSCSGASFFGGGGGQSSSSDQPPTGTPGPKPSSVPPGSSTPQPVPAGPAGGTPNGTPGTTPSAPGSVPPPAIGPNNQVNQPNPNTIVYGVDKVFHIGDGKFDDTSCKEQVSALPLSGTAFFFQFEVLNDNTTLNFNVNKLCGVDYSSNQVLVYDEARAKYIQSKYVSTSATSTSGSGLVLKKGVYSIYIKSGYGKDGFIFTSSNGDLDDFIVGNLTVNGSQPIRSIQYGAYKN